LVLDTNTVLALWHFDDPVLAPLARIIETAQVTLGSRDDALAELRCVLAYPRFAIPAARQADIVDRYQARLHPPVMAGVNCALPLCRDPDDQKFLEIACEQAATHLLTRDRLLLKLGRHRLLRGAFRIMTPEHFQNLPRTASVANRNGLMP
jgi:putative PIN family toxin of toxin-antitoxin system